MIGWLIQTWSDVGVQDWAPMICCGFALGIGASVARQVAEQGELDGVSPEQTNPLVLTEPTAAHRGHDLNPARPIQMDR